MYISHKIWVLCCRGGFETKNFEVANILKEIAVFLEMDDVQFKPRAYEKAARSIEALQEDVEEIYRKGGIKALMEIPGVGKSIAEKIEELIKTGRIKYYEELREKVPVDLESLSGIEGLGPKTIKTLWQELKIRNIEDLEKAALAHKICKLPGFKEKTEQNILKGIEFAKRSKGRFILGFTLPLIRDIENRLKSLPETKRVVVSGSVRRMKETIGDADFLVISDNPKRVMDFFVSMPEVVNIIGKGETKSSVKLKTGMDVDVRVVPEESFGAALQYFTGSKDHNVALRRIAQEKGWKLSEYGLFEGEKQIAGRTEEEIYKKLGLQWIPPELRENTGEIDAARKNKLPKLVDYQDLRGDLQVHSNWTDGVNTIREMAEEAKKLGLEYIVISDHSKSLAMTGGLDEKMLLKQGEEIDALNEQISGIRILKGVELNILKDGSLDISDETLEELDVVSAGIHSQFKQSREEMTRRVLKAIENPNLDILCHPTTREIQKRDPVPLDMDKIIEAAKDNGTILDIDSYPDRLDLKDEYIRKAVEVGAKLGISSDAHSKPHLHYLELGIAQARRGWATAKDIVNTRKVEEFLKMVKS
ncbi:MAG: DNA polymerase/3'-5' exonuclease PolX [Candidatus Freyarchaeota archaeon]|nr:DNA polymerase/3'-5' exonuclease PolX [Candidatus Jordarchaeia archaeon]MBS7280471.1 DNA polymerase/3'-5' exonuclease PolX [Candidatus Jordarchaeia archaeon]